jgi:uncharacterized protein YegP (UPF0339 family)
MKTDRVPGRGKKSRRQPRVECYRGRDGWRWRLIAGNGEIVAQGEGYRGDSSKARRAWAAVQRIARGVVRVDVVLQLLVVALIGAGFVASAQASTGAPTGNDPHALALGAAMVVFLFTFVSVVIGLDRWRRGGQQ